MVDRTTNKITKIFTSIFDPEQATK
jgi:hypothetical protein